MSLADPGLLDQFVTEARELLEEAGRSLLALERGTQPGAMAALFRAVHTLKGTSGLFEVAPLTRVVHAAEDLLAAVQNAARPLTAEEADRLLAALDQVGAWVEALAATRALPANAEDAATALAGGLRGTPEAVAAVPTTAAPIATPDWARALRGEVAQGATLAAIRYQPDAHCFFRGEDPLALMRQLPGLRLLRAEPVEPWPALDALDPFHCNLRFLALAEAAEEELAPLFRYVPEQVEIIPPAATEAPAAGNADPALLATLLEGQRRLLSAEGPAEARIEAAARALAGALRWAGRQDLAPALEAALAAARQQGPAPLLAFIAGWSDPPAAPPLPAPEARPAGPVLLRVEQGRIDALMLLIGELVVAKNALAYLARQAEQGSLPPRALAREIKDRHALFNRIAEDMQAAVMAVRMLPVDHIFQRFPRLVRDIARRLGKQVALVVEGAETEADKTVIESLADPLIHMVRNSLDHGIERPEERLAAGKPAEGTLRLSATQEQDSVIIRIADDGRGIDPAAVRRKAVEKGLLDAARAAALPDQDAIMLVFAPGFSTAAAVSDLSGRGVGMDVVRTAVEKAGGEVSLTSRLGQGTVVELRLPLSMAVTRIMTVACGERLFGVPMAAVTETVRIPRSALHCIRDREAFVLRDGIVPVLRLHRLLDLPEPEAAPEEEAILVVRVNGERLGIVVGAFRDQMEAIVRPMEGVLAGLRGFAGTTLLGDGRVLLILELRELLG